MKEVKFEPELEELLVKAQKAFRKYKGTSSVEFLREVREEKSITRKAL